MRKSLALAFVIALFVTAPSQLLTASAQDKKEAAQSPKPEPAKARADDLRAPLKTKAEAPSKPDDAKPQGPIQLGTDIVNVMISVTDPYGRFVTGLAKDHFDVFDDKVKQQIAHFTDEDAPVSLGIVYDVSGSMKERVNRSIRALRRFIDSSHIDDDFFLIGFNDRAKLVQDFTTSGESVIGHLMFVNPKGSTALYDAAYIAVEKVQQGRHSKKALLIISDGQDNNSRYTYKELRNRVKEADVQIYAIGITDPASDSLSWIWPVGARRDHPDDRRARVFPERLQRARTGRDLHANRTGASASVFGRLLSDRYSKRSQVAQGPGQGESAAGTWPVVAFISRRLSIVQEVASK